MDVKQLRHARAGFPFLFGGTFIEGLSLGHTHSLLLQFPFLFGGTFIEGGNGAWRILHALEHFPSFSEGLSLRDDRVRVDL